MFESVVFVAFLWGAFSAVSLPLGSILGLTWKPNQKINSAFMAYGAGALLFALSIELFGHVPHHVEGHGNWALVAVVLGALAGGKLFDTLNSQLNDRGAFMRKLSSAKRYVSYLKITRYKNMLEKMSRITAFRIIPPDKIADLFNSLDEAVAEDNKPVFRQGDVAEDMCFIISGHIDIIIHEAKKKKKKVATLGPGDVFGEMGILMGLPRTADAIARGDVRLYKLDKIAFDKISKDVPGLKEELKHLAKKRLNELTVKKTEESEADWRQRTLDYLHKNHLVVTQDDVDKEVKHKDATSAGLAIWLGILIDGIPESIIIGILAVSPGGMSTAFIAGVFLANLPEAMSSSVAMSNGGMKRNKILMMWGSLCLMTGIGAAIGAYSFPANPDGLYFYFILAVEGLAAGAMLTMIAETMLPEAYEHGGSIVGMATLLGFLSALLVKIYG